MKTILLALSLTLLFLSGKAEFSDTTASESIVFVEVKDDMGNTLRLGTGVILEKGNVATNLHYVAGAKEVFVSRPGQKTSVKSAGFMAVNEGSDIVILKVPEIKGRPVKKRNADLSETGAPFQFVDYPENKSLSFSSGNYNRKRIIDDQELYEVISNGAEATTGGPVFQDDYLIGFTVGGYLDDNYYLYCVPVSRLNAIENVSFIIKNISALEDSIPGDQSAIQKRLMESLNSVLWIPFERAVELARLKGKKIIVDIQTEWCGWCRLMDKNTYAKKSVIRYINEYYYAVRLDAESHEGIKFKGQEFKYLPEKHVHELAYSLLNGKVSYPGTVFLDEDLSVLTVIPGYISPAKAEVILRYFKEDAYLDGTLEFEEFEQQVLSDSGSEK